MSEEEKVSLLHEFPADLDVLKSTGEDKKATIEDWDSFRNKWNQKLDLVKETVGSQ